MASYPTAGSSMLSTWNQVGPRNSQQTPNMSVARPNTGYTQYAAPIGPQAPVNYGNSTAPSPRSSAPVQQQQPSYQSPAMPNQDDYMREIDSAYGDSYNYLNNAEGQLNKDYPSVLDEINSQYGTSSKLLQNSRQSGMNELDTQLGSADNRKMDALSEARRLYDSLQRGYGQRFGGSSSAGQAASEIAGVEQQRQQGTIGRDYQQTVRQIETGRAEIEDKYQGGLLQLEQTKQQATNQANRDFQNKLLEINRMRGELSQNKASMRLQALQELRAQVYQIEAENRQFQQQLDLMKSQQMKSISGLADTVGGATQRGQSAVQGYQGASYAPTSDLGVSSNTRTQSTAPYVGQMSRDEDLTGYIMGSSQTDPRYLDYRPN